MISYRRFAAYGFILASWGALNTASPVAQDSAGYDITARTAGTLDNEKPSNLSAPRNFPVPYTHPPITLVIEERAELGLVKPETAFQALVEAIASLSEHDQAQIYPPGSSPFTYNDCTIKYVSPFAAEEVTYAVAVSSVRGIGEYMLENDAWTTAKFVRVSVKDNIIAQLEVTKSTGTVTGAVETY